MNDQFRSTPRTGSLGSPALQAAWAEREENIRRTMVWVMGLPWRQIFKISPLAIAALLMLIGLLSPMSRNLIGFGAAVIFVYLGFFILLKGRISS